MYAHVIHTYSNILIELVLELVHALAENFTIIHLFFEVNIFQLK
jgi:hypothetical protein